MNFKRISALIERDLRKFFRSPALMMVSMVLPLVQLIVLGYAFGGKVTGVKAWFRGHGSFRGIAQSARNVRRHHRGAADIPSGRIRFGAAGHARSADRPGARAGGDSARFFAALLSAGPAAHRVHRR